MYWRHRLYESYMFNRIEELIIFLGFFLNAFFIFKSISIRNNNRTNCFSLPIYIHHLDKEDYLLNNVDYPSKTILQYIKHPTDCPIGTYVYSEHKQNIFDDDEYIRIEKLCCSKNFL